MRNIYSSDGILKDLLCIDIETRPCDQAEIYINDHKEFSAPSHYKNDDAITRYISGRKKEELRKAGLHLPTARVWAIVIYDHATRKFHRFIDRYENVVLLECFNTMRENFNEHVLYGFNSRHFDFPMLIGAAIRNNITLPAQLQNVSLRSDVLDLFGHMKVRLNDLAYIMGDSKTMDGSSVADEWSRYCLGEGEAATRVIDYCQHDVEITARFVDKYTEDLADE